MKIKFILTAGLIFISTLQSETYTVNLSFEQPEDALNTLFKTQVFPHPVGNYGSDSYDIYLWNPLIDIEPGIINFGFTVFADLEINGLPVQYEFPISIPLTIPNVDISLSGINAFINGITDQVNSMDGPEWVKNIIINEYEGLELTLYPDNLLDMATSTIPEGLDITVRNLGFNIVLETDLLRFIIYIEIESNPLSISCQSRTGRPEYSGIGLKFVPSIPVVLNGYSVVSVQGTYMTQDLDLNMHLSPDTSSSIGIEFGSYIEIRHMWEIELYFTTEFGLWIYSYDSPSYDNWTTIYPTIIPNPAN